MAAEDHVYDGCFDTECNNEGCGATRAIKDNDHSFTNSNDGDCNTEGCSFRRVTSHTPGEAADCENAQTCTVCQAELAPALGHSYDNACDADCNTCSTARTPAEHVDADENRECDVCGAELPKKGLSGGAIAGMKVLVAKIKFKKS